jgi:hypothetical protein
MRQAKSGRWWRGRTFIGLLAAAALVPSAGAYVNGGDYYDTLRSFEKGLKSNGWGVRFTAPLAANCDTSKEVADGVKVAPLGNDKYQRFVNQLIGRALKALPGKDADAISTKDKREIARLARVAIRKAVRQNQQFIEKGQMGSLQYQVGVYYYKKWWETNYDGKRKVYPNGDGLVPFVALKIGIFQSRWGITR